MKINIEFDLSTIGFDQDPDTGEMYPTADLIGRVAQTITSQVTTYKLREMVEQEIRSIAREQAQEVIADILAGPLQRTDGYGNAKGDPTSVREMVLEQVDLWMRLPRGDSYSRSNTMGDTLNKIVDEILRREMQGTIDAAKKKISEEVLRLAVEGAAKALNRARVVG